MTPRIGIVRLYAGTEIPELYPGERATAQPIPLDEIVALLADADGPVAIPVREWIVEPMPGLYGAYLRWRYRLIGRWCGGRARLVSETRIEHVREE